MVRNGRSRSGTARSGRNGVAGLETDRNETDRTGAVFFNKGVTI